MRFFIFAVFLSTLALALIVTSLAQNTNFVDKLSKVGVYDEPEWFLEQVPFIEVPSREIEEVYYYRWSSLKRHLRYTLPGAGYIVTEFVHRVGYSQKFDTINAAAGHHIDEARWLRDTRYVKDYVNVWTREGAGAQQYSEWIADATLNFVLLTGETTFGAGQLDGLVNNFRGWDHAFEPQLNLYFISPHDDAMEHSASSEQTDDPYHGGLGYRPSFNSEMSANARAISTLARIKGNLELAAEFEEKAEEIRQAIVTHLWDSERTFFYHMYREDNPLNALLDTREEIGFFPWRWLVPPTDDETFNTAWAHLFDTSGFNTEFGPTTCEERSPWFDGNQTSQCCWWNGNSWPYSTGHTLRALASQVKNYRSTSIANADSYLHMLQKYARTQYKNGKPYVAECHSPYGDFWVCDSNNWSEHYAHSTYNDNVLADLIGIEPQMDDYFQINPIVPSSWDWFIVENLLYHGHNITVVWDRDGSKYNTGSRGLQIFLNGQSIARGDSIGLMRVAIPPPMPSIQPGYKRVENYAANVNGEGYPMASSSFSSSTGSDDWQAVDGRVFYDFIPTNRWSNFGSPNERDWFAIDFGPGRSRTVDEVRLSIYSDYESGHDVDCPTSVLVEYFSGGQWTPAQSQAMSPVECPRNAVWTVRFTPVLTQQLRVVFENNATQGTFVGITEIEAWAEWPQVQTSLGVEVYESEDGLLTGEAAMSASPSASSGSFVRLPGGDSALEFTGVFSNPTETTRTVQLHYANTHTGVISATLLINNENEQSLELQFPPTTQGSGEFPPQNNLQFDLTLLTGHNVLILKVVGENALEIDKLSVLPIS